MDILALTEEQFLQRSSELREEFVDGEVMSLSPESLTSEEIRWLLGELMRHCARQGSGGRVLGPNFPVRLRPGLRRIPDLLYLSRAREGQLTEKCLEGACDLVVEIVSGDSVERDWRDKYLEYEVGGIPEYWVIDPVHQRLVLYRLDPTGRYADIAADASGWLVSAALPGLRVKAEWLWCRPLPDLREVVAEAFPA